MRTAGLLVLALAILFPVFAHAVGPITLNPYTISHDTIYPFATVESGLATTTAIDIRFSEQVKASIKIMSASGTKVRLLYPSSGSSSGPVTDPTPKIWDGTNDAGTRVDVGVYTILISATSTVPGGSTMTDSSKTITVASSDSTPPDTSSDETSTSVTTSSSGGLPTEYLPIPELRIIAGGNRVISSGADTVFTAVVYDGKGNKRDDALVTWSFGDGMQRTGASVFHKYYDPGEYLAVVHVTTASDGGNALAEVVVTVKDASIKISSVSSRGITLLNSDSRTLNLSLWRLSMGGMEFKIPEDTQILAGRSILFPSQVIELPVADSASLLYPSGEVAATYPETKEIVQLVQPSAPQTSFNEVQTVESFTNTKTNIQAYDEAVSAPAATTELAAAGAALPTATSTEQPKSGGLFKSPWFYSLLGVIALAGTAFIFI